MMCINLLTPIHDDYLHWQVHTGNGPHLLLVHGFLSSRAQWTLNLMRSRWSANRLLLSCGAWALTCRKKRMGIYASRVLAQFEQIREILGAAQWLLRVVVGRGLTMRYALNFRTACWGRCFQLELCTGHRGDDQQRKLDANAMKTFERGLAAVEALRVSPTRPAAAPDSHAELLNDAALIDPQAIADSYESLNPVASVREHVHKLQVPTAIAAGIEKAASAMSAPFRTTAGRWRATP